MEEENVNGNPGQAPEKEERKGNAPESDTPDLGKFKSVDALLRAYGELEAEFTRRSQRLKALEENLGPAEGKEEGCVSRESGSGLAGEGSARSAEERRGVPLMTSAGTGVTAPAVRPSNFREAGKLALGYLRNRNN